MDFSNDEFLGFARYARSKSGEWRLHFNWRRILLILAALAVLAYFALAGMLFCWFRYKHDWEKTTYVQMLVYPFDVETRMELRRGIGDKTIVNAREHFKEDRDFAKYLRSIRAGLSYSAYNPDARVDFSALLFYQRRTQEAFDLLHDGLPYAINHKTYTQFFVRQCLDCAYDDLLSETADALLPLLDTAVKVLPSGNIVANNRLLLVVGSAQANLLRGRFDRARELISKFGLEKTLSGRVMQAQIDWESGNREAAIATLAEVYKVARAAEQVGLLYAVYLKEDGQLSRARDVFVRLSLECESPTIRVRVITLLDGDENRTYREYLEKKYFERYKDDSASLIYLAQYAADSKNFALMKKIYDHAHAAVLIDLPKFELLYVEALIVNNQSDAALKILEELDSGNFVWVKNYRGVLDCLRALAYFSTNQANLGKISLDRVLKNQSVPAARLVVFARRLADLGLEQDARDVYENAFLRNNSNQTVLLELIKYALKNEDVPMLVRYLPPLLDTRRPPRIVLERVQKFLGSDRMLFVARRENLVLRVQQVLGEGFVLGSEETKDESTAPLQQWF